MNSDLNSEERDILERFERDEVRPAPDAEREIDLARQAARNTLNKTRASEPPHDRTRLQPGPLAG